MLIVMAEDKKPTDVKDLFNKDKLQSLFGNNGSIIGNKLFLYVVFTTVVSLVLIYFIYVLFDNQGKYNEQKLRFDTSTAQLASIENEFKNIIKNNKAYFKELEKASKTKSELSSKITILIGNYGLELKKMDLNNAAAGQKASPAMSIEVQGKYLNLIRFTNELNNLVAASQVNELKVTKVTGSRDLLLSVELNFSGPPTQSLSPSASLYQNFNSQSALSQKYLWSDIYSSMNQFSDIVKVGFTENEPFSQTVPTEPEPSNSARDPFAEPDSSPRVMKRTGGNTDNLDEMPESYFLSGTLISSNKQYCIIISPEGDSRYYRQGDYITKKNKKIYINKIMIDQIFVGKKNDLIKVGDEVK